MRMIVRASVVAPALLVALAACGAKSGSGTNPGDALVGEWNGKCSTARDQDDSKAADDVIAKLRFTKDGRYFDSIAGHGQLAGNYTVAGQTITVTSNGTSVKINYTIKDGTLATKVKGKLADGPVTSTCTLRQTEVR